MVHVAVLVGVRVFDSAERGLERRLECQLLHCDVPCGNEWFGELIEGCVIGVRNEKLSLSASIRAVPASMEIQNMNVSAKTLCHPQLAGHTSRNKSQSALASGAPDMARRMTHIFPGAS